MHLKFVWEITTQESNFFLIPLQKKSNQEPLYRHQCKRVLETGKRSFPDNRSATGLNVTVAIDETRTTVVPENPDCSIVVRAEYNLSLVMLTPPKEWNYVERNHKQLQKIQTDRQAAPNEIKCCAVIVYKTNYWLLISIRFYSLIQTYIHIDE